MNSVSKTTVKVNVDFILEFSVFYKKKNHCKRMCGTWNKFTVQLFNWWTSVLNYTQVFLIDKLPVPNTDVLNTGTKKKKILYFNQTKAHASIKVIQQQLQGSKTWAIRTIFSNSANNKQRYHKKIKWRLINSIRVAEEENPCSVYYSCDSYNWCRRCLTWAFILYKMTAEASVWMWEIRG